MCQFTNWYADEDGYVIQCKECMHFQVSFGTIMLTLDEQQYQTFVAIVAAKKQALVPMQDCNCKCIILPTPSSAVNIVLSEKELNFLFDMTQAADNELKASQLLSLFQKV
ncbi:hypothetical protein DC498_24555 [Terrimonas sp.]|uniref:DUF6686 family protein n=1 Tax=Terrimonas sp. TaxID=1914338 RepID=UPI000D5134B8|nr:DUF6686 family protein [Terrimonas sp.]PVD49567.1 hypothetical protein DC498_24555 [Terrimonas sp.]